LELIFNLQISCCYVIDRLRDVSQKLVFSEKVFEDVGLSSGVRLRWKKTPTEIF
jgi:hypothetical protein